MSWGGEWNIALTIMDAVIDLAPGGASSWQCIDPSHIWSSLEYSNACIAKYVFFYVIRVSASVGSVGLSLSLLGHVHIPMEDDEPSKKLHRDQW